MELVRATIGDELRLLLGTNWRSPEMRAWAPNAFAISGWMLEASGGYTHVLQRWPPNDHNPVDWTAELREAAEAFRACSRRFFLGQSWSLPKFVEDRWTTIFTHESVFLDELRNHSDVCDALVGLVAVADEACVGFGLPRLGSVADDADAEEKADAEFLEQLQLELTTWTTLTPAFPTSRLITLPKQHTPRFGITLRSLTHHLALFTGGEVSAGWSIQPEPRGTQLNLLVIPWPFDVRPSQFAEANCATVAMVDSHHCFDFRVGAAHPKDAVSFRDWLARLFDNAKSICGSVNGVIFPEAALTPDDFEILDEVALAYGAFVVCGVASREQEKCHSRNEVWMTFGEDESRLDRRIRQSKHHRWQLDRSQIEMYGLGGSLDPNFRWWEHVEVDSREVNFVALHGLLTMCCLVCEDLARQDPVARLVRSVGPNLVIALLSDGPQLSARWPARYATVLADDPGSSVLTVTNLGMTKLAEPPAGKTRSRAIALWKDAFGGLKEIVLEPGSAGVVLNLWTRVEAEVSADGRSDQGVAAFPQLAGTHQVII